MSAAGASVAISGGGAQYNRLASILGRSRRAFGPFKSFLVNTFPTLVRHDQKGRVMGLLCLQPDFVRRTVCRAYNTNKRKTK